MLPWYNICTLCIAAGLSWGNWDTGTAVGGAGFVDGVGPGGEAQKQKIDIFLCTLCLFQSS